MEHTKTRMEETITREQKIVFIKANGWFSMWSDDNWLTSREGNHDWGGRSLESAYQQCLEDLDDGQDFNNKKIKPTYIKL
jgi:hypothetical protein